MRFVTLDSKTTLCRNMRNTSKQHDSADYSEGRSQPAPASQRSFPSAPAPATFHKKNNVSRSGILAKTSLLQHLCRHYNAISTMQSGKPECIYAHLYCYKCVCIVMFVLLCVCYVRIVMYVMLCIVMYALYWLYCFVCIADVIKVIRNSEDW
jgi:hypothetical protein